MNLAVIIFIAGMKLVFSVLLFFKINENYIRQKLKSELITKIAGNFDAQLIVVCDL